MSNKNYMKAEYWDDKLPNLAAAIRNLDVVAPKLYLNTFRILNVSRAVEGFKCYKEVPITFWTTALAGELGELCNMIKKISRVDHGGIDAGSSYKASDITAEMIKEEIGGIFIYLDLLASLLELSLEDAIIETFNSKSKELGLPQIYKP